MRVVVEETRTVLDGDEGKFAGGKRHKGLGALCLPLLGRAPPGKDFNGETLYFLYQDLMTPREH